MVAPALVAIGKAVAPSIIDAITDIIDRFVPDPEQRQRAVQEVLGVLQTSDAAQVEINKIEAASSSLWVAGPRPAAIWVCVAGMAYAFIAQPVLTWASVNFGWIAPPMIASEALMTLLFGLLGLGAYRTVERVRGVIPRGQ